MTVVEPLDDDEENVGPSGRRHSPTRFRRREKSDEHWEGESKALFDWPGPSGARPLPGKGCFKERPAADTRAPPDEADLDTDDEVDEEQAAQDELFPTAAENRKQLQQLSWVGKIVEDTKAVRMTIAQALAKEHPPDAYGLRQKELEPEPTLKVRSGAQDAFAQDALRKAARISILKEVNQADNCAGKMRFVPAAGRDDHFEIRDCIPRRPRALDPKKQWPVSMASVGYFYVGGTGKARLSCEDCKALAANQEGKCWCAECAAEDEEDE